MSLAVPSRVVPFFRASNELHDAYRQEEEWALLILEFGFFRRADLAEGTQTFMYFVQHQNGPIKIGVSRSPESRIKNLQVGSPVKDQMTLLCYVPGTSALEKWVHRILKPYRQSGEWFEPHPRVLATVYVFLCASQILHDYGDAPDTEDTLECAGSRIENLIESLSEKFR